MSPKLVPVVCVLCAVAAFEAVDLIAPRHAAPGHAAAPTAKPSPEAPSLSSIGTNGSAPTSKNTLVALPGAGATLLEISKASERAGSPSQSRLALMEAINRLKPDELENMLSKEALNADFYRSFRFDFQFAAKRLSELAPEKAAALWLKTKSTLVGIDTLLLPWAYKDPQQFASWSVTLPAEAQRAVATSLGHIASERPESFTNIAAQLKDTPAGVAGARNAIAGMISKAAKGTDPAEALNYAKGLPEGSMRTSALAELARWPGLDLASHPEVATALASMTANEARRYLPQIANAADKIPLGPVREAAFASQISNVARNDPQAAARRVEALNGTPDYSAAVRGFVEATAAKDPTAAIEWALTIDPKSKQRAAALEKAAAEFFRQKPADARKWVQSAQLSPSEYQILTGQTR